MTCSLQGLSWSQYCWSMMIRFFTFFILIFINLILVAFADPPCNYNKGHVNDVVIITIFIFQIKISCKVPLPNTLVLHVHLCMWTKKVSLYHICLSNLLIIRDLGETFSTEFRTTTADIWLYEPTLFSSSIFHCFPHRFSIE